MLSSGQQAADSYRPEILPHLKSGGQESFQPFSWLMGHTPPFLIFNQVNLLRCKFSLPEEVCVGCELVNCYF